MSSSTSGSWNFVGLLGANTILGAAMPMLIILGGLAGLLLAPATGLATFPPSVQMLAGLVAAAPFSWLMGRYGRKTGFVVGGGFAIVGGAIGTLALYLSSFWLLCLAHMALGAALACYQYFRFAAAEVVSEKWQPVAISLMLTSGLVAAFAGPQVFISAKDLLAPTPLAGAYAAISALTVIGLLPLAFVRFAARPKSDAKTAVDRAAAFEVLQRRPVLSAVIVGATSQAVMVLLMTSTPLAMTGHGFDEVSTGDVIRWHVVAMFAPSFFTGFLIKRFGTTPVVALGLVLLAVSAAVGASGVTPHHFYGSLVLLGLGWNFGFIGATSMLASAVSADDRSLVQGANDTIIALAATVCAFAGGAIVSGYGWAILSIAALPILLAALLSLLFLRDRNSMSSDAIS